MQFLNIFLPLKTTISQILVRVSLFEVIGDKISTETIVRLVELLDTETEMELKNDIIFIIGNIVSESTTLRDQFVAKGVVKSLLNVIESTIYLVLLSNATWALSNICFRRDPPPDFSQCSLCIPSFAKLIPHEHYEVTTSCCYAMGYLISGFKLYISKIIDAGVCPRLVKLLDSSNRRELTLAVLFLLRRLVGGTDEEIQHILECETLTYLKNLLQSNDDYFMAESCFIISNIAAGNFHNIQAVIDSGAIEELLTLVQSNKQEIKLEAAIAIRQCLSASRTQPSQVEFIVSQGCIEILSQQMTSTSDTETLKALLRALMTILDYFSDQSHQKHDIMLLFTICCKLCGCKFSSEK